MVAASPQTLAAIDAGSNGIRLAIGRVGSDGQLEEVENLRESIRLGHDVFAKGVVSRETIQRMVRAFEGFRRLMDRHGVDRCRAVATSAMREARNRDMVVSAVAQASGIEISVIGAEEEARLVYMAVANRLDLRNKLALLIDIGGGSVEIAVVDDGRITGTESFRMGTVRLLQGLEQPKGGERRFNQLVREYVDATSRRLKKEIAGQTVDCCIATGGNVESLGDLRHTRFHRDNNLVTLGELDKLIHELQSMTYEDRVHKLGLRPDRADVIVPAAIVLQKVLKQASVEELMIPHVGLKEGLLLDLAEELRGEANRTHRDQVMNSALQLGRKYGFDESHGSTVTRFAVQLFDETRLLHNLADDCRLLLEVAGLLHDVGYMVNATAHHKHSYYLLSNSPLIGLTDTQREIVANVARYHRKSAPGLQHEPYRALSAKERIVVSKLTALLRLADALDKEHAGKVRNLRVELKRSQLVLHVQGESDLLLERWAIVKNSVLFEELFGVRVAMKD